MTSPRLAVTLLAAIAAAGCGDNGSTGPDAGAVDAGSPDAGSPDAGDRPLTIAFAARINGAAFACGQSYSGVGATAATYVASDFRFYLHDLRLTDGSREVPVTLTASAWQTADGIALLDFEDGGTGCQMGSAGTSTTVVGTVAAGSYTGIKFRLGVPFAHNHLDATTAVAPLNVPAMYWAWSSGYKFLKADGAVAGQGFNLHLGSTVCGATGQTPPTAPCANPNVAEIALTGFDPAADTIVADLGAVLAGADVAVNTAATAPGCMSFPGDPECTTILPRLGLPYGELAAGSQALFAVE